MKDSTSSKVKTTHQWSYTGLSIFFLIMIWWVGALAIGKSYILPTPFEALVALKSVVLSRDFWLIVGMTTIRVLVCVVSSLIVGTFLGVTAGVFEIMEYLLKPILLVTRTLPTIVIIVYVILWMPSALAPIFVTFVMTFPIVYANVLEGFKQTDKKLIEMARLYGVHLRKQIKMIYWPSIVPYLKSSIVAITSLGLKVIIASEVLSQTEHSVGKSFQMAKINIQTEAVFAWAIVTIILSLTLNWVMKQFMKRGSKYGKTV